MRSSPRSYLPELGFRPFFTRTTARLQPTICSVVLSALEIRRLFVCACRHVHKQKNCSLLFRKWQLCDTHPVSARRRYRRELRRPRVYCGYIFSYYFESPAWSIRKTYERLKSLRITTEPWLVSTVVLSADRRVELTSNPCSKPTP